MVGLDKESIGKEMMVFWKNRSWKAVCLVNRIVDEKSVMGKSIVCLRSSRDVVASLPYDGHQSSFCDHKSDGDMQAYGQRPWLRAMPKSTHR